MLLMLVTLVFAQDTEETQSYLQQKLASIAQITGGTYSYNPAGILDPFRPFL